MGSCLVAPESLAVPADGASCGPFDAVRRFVFLSWIRASLIGFCALQYQLIVLFRVKKDNHARGFACHQRSSSAAAGLPPRVSHSIFAAGYVKMRILHQYVKRAMTDRWTEFLEEQDITAGEDGYSHSGSENVDTFQKLTGDTLCDLRHTVLVCATGDDAEDFLHNQLSNDIRELGSGQAALAGYCNPKGRLLGIFRVWREDSGFLLQMPADLQQPLTDRLRKYVLRSDVELTVDPARVAFGVCGKTAARGLEQITGQLPDKDNYCHRDGEFTVTRIPGDGRPRFQVVGPVKPCMAAWDKLKQHATIVGSWTWARLDILAGMPNIGALTSEAFIPQMVNLDLLGGVSFRKGCYPGQEIVARMHYLGNLKQRMARFRMDDDRRPVAGDRVYMQGETSPIGTVVDGQPGPASGWELLAVVRIADVGRHTLCLRNGNGPVLFQQELPYEAFPDQVSEAHGPGS